MIDPALFEELLPLTVPEVRRLLRLVMGPAAPEPRRSLAWSVWRRRHQARAKRCHYRRRLALIAAQVRL